MLKKLQNEIILTVGIVTGLVIRIILAMSTNTPGHGDSAFYYTVAKNITLGRGFVIDYVWHYLNGLPTIPHYSSDFWHPLSSIFMAIPLRFFGISVFNALLASISAGTIIALISYFVGKSFFQSSEQGVAVSLLTYFSQVQIYMSLTTEANIYFGVFGLVALYLLIFANRNPKYFLFAAVTSGILHLIRQDGILMLATIIVCILLSEMKWNSKIKFITGAFLIHIGMIMPLMFKNFSEFGAPFPPGPSSTMFLTNYEDFYCYGQAYSVGGYYHALGGIAGILVDKYDAFTDNLSLLEGFITPVVTWAFLISFVDLIIFRRDWGKPKLLSPVLIYAAGAFVFYIFIASYSRGSLMKSLAFLTPFLSIFIIDFIYVRIKPKYITHFLLLLLVIYSTVNGVRYVQWSGQIYNSLYSNYHLVKEAILADANKEKILENDIVVMVRDPWEFTEATQLKSIMIPNNDLETIVSVAQFYGADYLLLPAPRTALEDLNINNSIPPFTFIENQYNYDELKIYRIGLKP